MKIAHRWSDRNLTRIELVMSIVIITVIIGAFSRHALGIFSAAEQSMVNQTLSNINTGLAYRAALAHLRGDYEQIDKLVQINPMDDMQELPAIDDYNWPFFDSVPFVAGGLVTTPANYGGVIFSDDDENLEKGKWYFNRTANYLEYIISNSELFEGELEGLPRIRFRTKINYHDENNNGEYDPETDKFQDIRLEPITDYKWGK